MKKFLVLILMLLLSQVVVADTFYLSNANSYITIVGSVPDSIYGYGSYTPDSLIIVTILKGASPASKDTIQIGSSDARMTEFAITHSAVFTDQFSDMGGTLAGTYILSVMWIDNDESVNFHKIESHTVICSTDVDVNVITNTDKTGYSLTQSFPSNFSSMNITASGNVGLDWATIENPATAQNLSATNFDVDQIVASVSGNVDGSVGSVAGAVGSVTGSVGSISGITFPPHFEYLDITETTGYIIVGSILDGAIQLADYNGTPSAWWNIGKTGYTLTTQDWSTHSQADVWTAGSRELSTPNNYKADISDITDSIYAVIDSLQNPSRYMANVSDLTDSIYAIIDSLQSQFGWVSKLTENSNIGIDLDDVIGTLSDAEIENITVTVGDKTGFALTTAEHSAIGDSTWLKSINAYTGTSGCVADVLYDSLDAKVSNAGGVASISDADMAAIGDTVWLKLANAYAGTPGCFGDVIYDSLDAAVSSAGGAVSDADMSAIADSITLRMGATISTHVDSVVVLLDADSSIIAAALVLVQNSSGDYVMHGNTDANGVFTFGNLNGVHWLSVTKPGYRYAGIDTVNYTASYGDVDTMFMAGFSPGAATPPTLCRVWGYFYNAFGDSMENVLVEGSLYNENSVAVRDSNGIIISPFISRTTSDVHGYWYLDCYPSTDLVPNMNYQFIAQDTLGTVVTKTVIVPDSASWRFTW